MRVLSLLQLAYAVESEELDVLAVMVENEHQLLKRGQQQTIIRSEVQQRRLLRARPPAASKLTATVN
jgi:hypothetical protein